MNNGMHKCSKIVTAGCSLILFLMPLLVGAQTTLQVVTKTIEKNFTYREGINLNIKGEKAVVEVRSWEKDEIKVVLDLIARHPEKKQAEIDLEKLEYYLDDFDNMVVLQNTIQKDNENYPVSNLKAYYSIYLPPQCPVFVENNYGKINIRDLMNQLKIDSEFCKIHLDRLTGDIWIDTQFGDIEGHDLDGQVTINSHRSDITLYEAKGSYDINANYALIRIFADESLVNLDIAAEKSDVQFFHTAPASQSYTLVAQYGGISTPPNMNLNWLENSDQMKRAQYRPTREMTGVSVNIQVSFGTIKVDR